MSFFDKAKTSVSWVFIENLFLKVFTLAVVLILTRLLSPEDFGLVGLMTIFIATGKVIIEGGMSASLIRDNEATNVDYSSIFIGNLLVSLLLYLLLFITAPYISIYFERPVLSDLIRIYGITFIISAFSTVQSSILIKEMSFKKLTLLNLPGTILGSVLAIVMAIQGFGVWSLVVMYLATQFLQSLALWLKSSWKPDFNLEISILKKHFNFGYKLMFSSLLNTAFTEVYTFIIGKRFAFDILGYYTQARTFNLQPVNFINSIISKATYPLLASIQQDKRKIAEAYQTILRILFFVITPFMLLLAVIAEPVFFLLFSEEWQSAVPFFQVMALSSLLIPIHGFNINVFKVYNRTDLFLKLEIIKRFLTLLLIAITWYLDIYGLLWGMVLLSYLSLFINTYYSGDLIDYKTLDQIRDMAPIFFYALTASLAAYLLLNFLDNFHEFLQIIMASTSFVFTYITFCMVTKNQSFSTFLKLAAKLSKKSHSKVNISS